MSSPAPVEPAGSGANSSHPRQPAARAVTPTTAAVEPPQPPPNTILHLLVISGPSGTGKSTLAYEVCHRLRSGIPSHSRTSHTTRTTARNSAQRQQPSQPAAPPPSPPPEQQSEDTTPPATRKVMHAHISADNLDALFPRDDDDDQLMLQVFEAQWRRFWRVFCERWARPGERRLGLWRRGCGGPASQRGLGGDEWVGGGEALLLIDGTAVVLALPRIMSVVRMVVDEHRHQQRQRQHGDGDGGQSRRQSVTASEVEISTTAIVLEADPDAVEERLRRRVLGGELEEHLDSTRRMRGVLRDWAAAAAAATATDDEDSGQGDGLLDGGQQQAVVKKVKSDRPLQEVTDEVLRICGLCS